MKDALPKGQNSPQKCKYGLYAEQLNGTAFTAPRASNLKAWLYRIQPSVNHLPYEEKGEKYPWMCNDFMDKKLVSITPQQLRWKPLPLADEEKPRDFVEGIVTATGCGHPSLKVTLS